MTPIIEVEGLWTRFGDHVVHQDLNLTVNPGEVVSLVGGSGSGKTTLMRQMLGLEQPSQGRVKVFGISLHDSDTAPLKKIRKRWGVLFQEGALYSALSVYDNIALPLRELRAFDEDFVHDMVMLKLDMVDIERRHAWKMPSDLSGGMIKRIALARALVLEIKYHRGRPVLDDMAEIFRRIPRWGAAVRGATLVPVPLHPRKARARGYNQAELLAEAIAQVAGGGTKVALLLGRRTDTESQTAFDRRTRMANLKNAFALAKGATLNPAHHYILVDDVFTTGSTLNNCACVLQRAGVLTIDVITFCHG